MMRNVVLLGFVLLFAGCNDTKNENTKQHEVKKAIKVVNDGKYHTKKYYLDNPNIMKKRIQECKNLTESSISIETDCRNANEALSAFRMKNEKFKSMKYYLKHPKERKDFIKKCKDSSFKVIHQKGCTNAMDAWAWFVAHSK